MFKRPATQAAFFQKQAELPPWLQNLLQNRTVQGALLGGGLGVGTGLANYALSDDDDAKLGDRVINNTLPLAALGALAGHFAGGNSGKTQPPPTPRWPHQLPIPADPNVPPLPRPADVHLGRPRVPRPEPPSPPTPWGPTASPRPHQLPIPSDFDVPQLPHQLPIPSDLDVPQLPPPLPPTVPPPPGSPPETLRDWQNRTGRQRWDPYLGHVRDGRLRMLERGQVPAPTFPDTKADPLMLSQQHARVREQLRPLLQQGRQHSQRQRQWPSTSPLPMMIVPPWVPAGPETESFNPQQLENLRGLLLRSQQ